MTKKLVHLDIAEKRATITLTSNENRNALSYELMEQLLDNFRRAFSDEQVRVLILRAEGSAFSSGLDLRQALERGMEASAAELVELQRVILAAPIPVLVRVHAAARAGSIGLIAAADVVICADDVSFAFTEAQLSIAPTAISATVLSRMNGRDVTWALLSGEVFDAQDAVRLGLVTRAVPRDQLDRTTDELARKLADSSRQGLCATKQLVNRLALEDVTSRGAELAATSARLFASEEAQAAFSRIFQR